MQSERKVTDAIATSDDRVVKQLSEKGAKVKTAVHSKKKAGKIKDPGIEVTEMDCDNPDSLERAFHGLEKLFMLTPFAQDIVKISAQLIVQAANFGVKRIVKLSVMGADAEPGITLSR